MNVFHQRSLVEVTPGRWKMLGELTVEEHEQMRALARRGQELRAELIGMIERWHKVIDEPGCYETLPGEVRQANDPDDLSYLRAQRAVDAMRAHVAALGLE